MINKILGRMEDAFKGLKDGATIMVGGFGGSGIPHDLIDCLVEQDAKDLVIITNNAGSGETGIAALLKARRVRKIICSYPRMADSHHFETLYRSKQIELELVPQGNLAERIRAQGAGLGGFFTQTAYGTLLAQGKETRLINGKHYVFETPLAADFALIRALRADRYGNLVYRKAARNFGPVMATAAKTTIAQVSELVEIGEIDPETVVTPGIFVQHVALVRGES
ncbi:3-oxoadipate CoA-transferase subunit A [Polynucleobacter sp. SHI8]|uniref:3-oxoacid CoA-transferase subunit A n=1 Tax=unclassified Polynucleobacter TaxID=2640945 RepID=UPI002492E986|nr:MULTISPECIES: 3-oxoacid CoA-transferase subunit A [unclassified Polynucleobacter]BDW11220.1 3-oxoadipate CoA-transferase subunit A [Polynucleobacter sp. SHI2]BDW13666.1 3-oxoadipate CoA-transferase subunit A [Polynucleobacter sp. SHI8]